MKKNELIKKLEEINGNHEIVIFADGKLYPLLDILNTDDETIELGCGWCEIED